MTSTTPESQFNFMDKIRGEKVQSGLPYPSLVDIIAGGLGGLVIMGLLSFITFEQDWVNVFIVPFGATAVLVFAAPTAPFSQPRNFIGGHLVAGLSGIIVMGIFDQNIWWTLALANCLAISLMVATKTVHPPAGATSLLPVLSGITSLSWLWSPVLLGCLIFLAVAVVYNNLWVHRKYPSFWI